jgi:hypothetical protein
MTEIKLPSILQKSTFENRFSKLKNSDCVFIIAQGRSGSTLLLKLLNSINSYNICGENHGAISQLSAFYDSILRTDKLIPKAGGKNLEYSELFDRPPRKDSYSGFEWYNVYQLNFIEDKLRELVFGMFNHSCENRVWGFKEIRFGLGTIYNNFNINYDKFSSELNFLKQLFPQAKFVFLTRNTDDLVKSAWWADNPEQSRKTLEKQKYLFQEYENNNSDFCYRVYYHDLINKTHRLEKMYDFLGEEFDLKLYQKALER